MFKHLIALLGYAFNFGKNGGRMNEYSALLLSYGGTLQHFRKGEAIYQEGSIPRFYFLVVNGKVVLSSNCPEGKDVTQGIFTSGESFGEPPLLVNQPYPATAVASEDSDILKLSRDAFLQLLDDEAGFARNLLFKLADRIYDKTLTVKILAGQSPKIKLISFFEKLNIKADPATRVLIPFTRQQLADFTGLRVETVIRTISRMHEEKLIEVRDHKVYF